MTPVCQKGHPMTPENTQRFRNKGKVKKRCRICFANYQTSYAQQRAGRRTVGQRIPVDSELSAVGRFEKGLATIEAECGVKYADWAKLPIHERQALHRALTDECRRLASLPGAEIPWDPAWDLQKPPLQRVG